jgi:hypothetical protein
LGGVHVDGAGNRARYDNVIFLSVIVSRIPPAQAKRARQIGIAAGAGVPHRPAQPLVWLIG